MARKHLFWAVPLLLLSFAVVAGLVALPAFVAAPAHRTTIENFASRLTGRTVQINGALSLSYLPQPHINATGIIISGPNHETITARALSFDISLIALLRGQFSVNTLHVVSPVISFPWPIPGGIDDIAPPPWMAALHAQISNGGIRVGTLDFNNVNADIRTGSDGRVHMTGTGELNQNPITLTLSLGQTAIVGGTALSAQGRFADTSINLDGFLDKNSQFDGQLALQMPDNISGAAHILLNATTLTATDLNLQQGPAHVSGTATLRFTPLLLTATIASQSLDLSHAGKLKTLWPQELPMKISLHALNTSIAGHVFTTMQAIFISDSTGEALKNIDLETADHTTLKGDVLLAKTGGLSGSLGFSAPDFKRFAADFGLPPEPDWDTAALDTTLAGTLNAPDLTHISGHLGHDHVEGQILFSPHHAAFQLKFDHLALPALATTLRRIPPNSSYTADGELTVADAEAGAVRLNNLFIDADFANGLTIRRATAALYGGMVGGNAVLSDTLDITSAHIFLNLPNAVSLANALHPPFHIPRALLNQPLSLVAAAAGSPAALSTSAVVKLGQFTFSITPLIDITNHRATGAISLRMPNAIEALTMLGLINGCSRMSPLPGYPFPPRTQACIASADNPGLAFPGPGSLSLTAYFIASPEDYGLTDFVFSAGRLNASGRLVMQKNHLSGQIAASTLALPALPLDTTLTNGTPFSGQIGISAGQVIYAGREILGPSVGNLVLSHDEISLDKIAASLGDGTVSGTIGLKFSDLPAPVLHASMVATNINASALNLPLAFPLRLDHGLINGVTTVSASGYTAKTWIATLSGNATLFAKDGELKGISLPNLVSVIKTATPANAALWMQTGTTPFTALSVSVLISQGNCSITQAQLTSPAGSLTAVGGVDLFDHSLALRLEAQLALQPPVTLTTRLIGPWANPGRITAIGAAYAATPTPPP